MNFSFDLDSSFAEHIVSGINKILPLVPNALFDLLVGILVIRLLKRLLRLVLKATRMQPGLRYVITSTVEILMWLLLIIALLNELGFTGIIYFFTGSIAAIGIAMAAGGSTLITDIVAGLFLAQDHDFNVGDEISVIKENRPITGTIERMDARRTRLRDSDGILHVVPNSIVERNEWMVVKRRQDITPLVKATNAARRLTVAAIEKKALAVRKKRNNGKNAQ